MRTAGGGLRPCVSTDDAPSAEGDMFATVHTAHVAQRGQDGSLGGGSASPHADRTGSLSPGKCADVPLLNAHDPTVFRFDNPAGTIVAAGHPSPVGTVPVARRVVKRGGRLLDVDVPTLRQRLVEPRDWIDDAAGVRLNRTWHPRSGSD